MGKLPKAFVCVIGLWIVLTYYLVQKNVSMFYPKMGREYIDKKQQNLSCNNVLEVSKCTTDQSFKTDTVNQAALKMEARVKRIAKKCEILAETEYMKRLKPTGKVWSYLPLRLSYCITPKVGCTIWKQFMRFIAFDVPEKQNIAKPSDIDRFFVHYGKVSNIRQAPVSNATSFANDRLFMFARDPFSRLWSAYIDKFYLPDFWRFHAKAIIQTVRQNVSVFQKFCSNNITFEEFLTFVVKRGRIGSFNEHWEPSHQVCSPCHANYEFVGKQETFARDSSLILSRFGFHHLISNESSLQRARSEIVMLVTYNLNLERFYTKTCFERLDIARRLWRAFQLNGYISINREFPKQELMTANFTRMKAPLHTHTLTQIILKVLFNQSTEEWQEIKLQKRQLMIEAYKQVPINIIKAVQEIYHFDFELFDYDPCPSDMFEFCAYNSTAKQ